VALRRTKCSRHLWYVVKVPLALHVPALLCCSIEKEQQPALAVRGWGTWDNDHGLASFAAKKKREAALKALFFLSP